MIWKNRFAFVFLLTGVVYFSRISRLSPTPEGGSSKSKDSDDDDDDVYSDVGSKSTNLDDGKFSIN